VILLERPHRGSLAIGFSAAGHGLVFHRTPDGSHRWTRLGRRCERRAPASWRPDDDGPDALGVREPARPRRPPGLPGAIALDPSDA
jgi:hypothetical protein